MIKFVTAWEAEALDSMRQAGEEKAKMALECGSVDENGKPMITVVCVVS